MLYYAVSNLWGGLNVMYHYLLYLCTLLFCYSIRVYVFTYLCFYTYALYYSIIVYVFYVFYLLVFVFVAFSLYNIMSLS
jgi:hypothetical protein